jgi:hypothetical protein
MKLFLAVAIGALAQADALSLSKHRSVHRNDVVARGHHSDHHHEYKAHRALNKAQVSHGHKAVSKSGVTNSDLIFWNEVAFWAALVQGLIILAVYIYNPTTGGANPDGNFNQVTNLYLTYPYYVPPPEGSDESGVIQMNQLYPDWFLFKWSFPLASAIFLLLTAFGHGSIITYLKPSYLEMINKGYNSYRWIEYSVTSSIMIVGVLVGFYILDFNTLLGLAVTNAATMAFGYFMEFLNYKNRQLHQATDWTPYWIGWVTGIAPWIALLISFNTSVNNSSSGGPPWFVQLIAASYFVFFDSFAGNMALQLTKN